MHIPSSFDEEHIIPFSQNKSAERLVEQSQKSLLSINPFSCRTKKEKKPSDKNESSLKKKAKLIKPVFCSS